MWESSLTLKAADKKITWVSSDTKVAKVSSKGKVTAVAPGKATITAYGSSGKKATCKITVTGAKVTKVTISGKNSRKVGAEQTLKVSVKPSNAENKKVSWKSSNTKVATVDKDGVVKAKKAGTVTITATAKDGSKKKATFKITVKKK